MAEIFGIVSGGAGIAGLFNNCVDCFEYIQLARHFGVDFGQCQLKLDLARNRLGRWGQAIDIDNNPSFQAEVMGDGTTISEVQNTLGHILHTFELAYEKSKHYKAGKGRGELALGVEDQMQPTARKLHANIVARARQRQSSVSVVRKAAWALYDKKRLTELVDGINYWVEVLEKMYPGKEADRRALAALEVEEIGDEHSLFVLRDVAFGEDELLHEAAAEKVKEITGRNRSEFIKSDETARVVIGNEWSQSVLGSNINFTDKTQNTAGTIEAKGNSIVLIGNRFGGKSVFDD